jgi:Asp/Glu/hydantoin racemase
MRIKVIVPFPLEQAGVELRRRGIPDGLVPSDVDIDFAPVRNGPASVDSIYDVFLIDMFVFEEGLKAEAEGYDAVCIDTVSDSGLKPLRSRLTIPVVGPGQVACHIALLLGERFSFLAAWGAWEHIYLRRIVHEYGLDRFLASVRSPNISLDLANLITEPDHVFPALLDQAEAAVEQDGAGVIVLASTAMWQAHDYLQERLTVPVVNPGVWSVKLAELMVRMGKAHSKHDYVSPVKPVDDRVFTSLLAQ